MHREEQEAVYRTVYSVIVYTNKESFGNSSSLIILKQFSSHTEHATIARRKAANTARWIGKVFFNHADCEAIVLIWTLSNGTSYTTLKFIIIAAINH